ncbi:Histidine kinase A [Balamuthia mandrillaris]
MDKWLPKGGCWMYGNHYPNDAAAMKAAGHELRSLARIVDSGNTVKEGVCVPLMTLIDYRGYRLAAMSVVPVSHETICYGSADGGVTVHADYGVSNRKFGNIFSRLNLKAHRVNNLTLHACGDIEGHLGADDHLYLLDYARLYPPECNKVRARYFPLKEPRAIFYKLLRPELVAANSVPLCSDAFSGFLKRDPNAEQHGLEVHQATETLVSGIIPLFASELYDLSLQDRERYYSSQTDRRNPDECGLSVRLLHSRLLHVLQRMHSLGINMRYLGLVRGCLRELQQRPRYRQPGCSLCIQDYEAMLFTEMAARVCKDYIRALLREKMKELKVPSEEPYRQLVLDLFNLFSGMSKHSENFWLSTDLPKKKKKQHTKKPSSSFTPSSPLSSPSSSALTSEESFMPPPLKGGAEYYALKLCRQREKEEKEREQLLQKEESGDEGKKRVLDLRKSAEKHKNQRLRRIEERKDQKRIREREQRHAEEIEALGLLLLPMKCSIIAKFGLKALSAEEWNAFAPREEKDEETEQNAESKEMNDKEENTNKTEKKKKKKKKKSKLLDIKKVAKLQQQQHQQQSDKQLLPPYYFQGLLFKRLCEMIGIVLIEEDTIFETLNGNPMPSRVPFRDHPYEFLKPHLVELAVRGKHMHMVSSCEGLALWKQCLRIEQDGRNHFRRQKLLLLREELHSNTTQERKRFSLTIPILDSSSSPLHSFSDRRRDSYDGKKVGYFTGLRNRVKSLPDPLFTSLEGINSLDCLWQAPGSKKIKMEPKCLEKIVRLLQFARMKLRQALSCIPDSVTTLLYLARIEHWLANHWIDGGRLKSIIQCSSLSASSRGISTASSSSPSLSASLHSSSSSSSLANSSSPVISSSSTIPTAISSPPGGSSVGLSSPSNEDKTRSNNGFVEEEERAQMMIRDLYASAEKYYRQAIEITRKSEERLASQQQQTMDPDKMTLIEASLERFRLLCEWAMAPCHQLKNQGKQEQQDLLLISAWKECQTLISTYQLAARWKKEIATVIRAIRNLKYVDAGTTVFTILKLKALQLFDEKTLQHNLLKSLKEAQPPSEKSQKQSKKKKTKKKNPKKGQQEQEEKSLEEPKEGAGVLIAANFKSEEIQQRRNTLQKKANSKEEEERIAEEEVQLITGHEVLIQSFNRKYLTAHSDDTITTESVPTAMSVFLLEVIERREEREKKTGKCYIHNYHELDLESGNVGEEEKKEAKGKQTTQHDKDEKKKSNVVVALRSASGKYVCANEDGRLVLKHRREFLRKEVASVLPKYTNTEKPKQNKKKRDTAHLSAHETANVHWKDDEGEEEDGEDDDDKDEIEYVKTVNITSNGSGAFLLRHTFSGKHNKRKFTLQSLLSSFSLQSGSFPVPPSPDEDSKQQHPSRKQLRRNTINNKKGRYICAWRNGFTALYKLHTSCRWRIHPVEERRVHIRSKLHGKYLALTPQGDHIYALFQLPSPETAFFLDFKKAEKEKEKEKAKAEDGNSSNNEQVTISITNNNYGLESSTMVPLQRKRRSMVCLRTAVTGKRLHYHESDGRLHIDSEDRSHQWWTLVDDTSTLPLPNGTTMRFCRFEMMENRWLSCKQAGMVYGTSITEDGNNKDKEESPQTQQTELQESEWSLLQYDRQWTFELLDLLGELECLGLELPKYLSQRWNL